MTSSSTIQISDLDVATTDAQLEEIFSDFGPLKRCFVVKAKKANAAKTKGIVQFSLSEDVDKLFEDTEGKIESENGLKVEFHRISDEKQKSEGAKSIEQREFDRKEAHKKKARLIIRNLSFKATDEKLKSHFSTYGDVVDVNILKKKDGKMVGCAFVQYANVKEAAKAMKELNGKDFLKRPVAIDWAVPKERFQADNPKPEQPEEEPEPEPESKNQDEEMKDVDDQDEEELGSDEDDEEDEDEEDMDGSDDDEGSDLEDDDGQPATKKPRWEKGHDVSENKTIFIRNLSFNSDEEDLRDMMEENFGKVLFARFVIDKATEHPKGTAFVKFASEESAVKAIEAAESQDGLWLDNRQIYAVMALKPEDAKQKQEEKKATKTEKKDSRNLYLAREGVVREGTQAAIGVSKTDLALRVQLEKRKKDMLKDLNRFISQTRLCVRNLPQNVNDQKLKNIMLKFSSIKLKITELRVMKDLKTGKSKGFAFVAFADHDMALNALRSLNNNPEVFTKDQRPIVEFSIENKKALNARQKRMEKSKEKNPTYNKENTVKGGKQNKSREAPKDSNENVEDAPNFMGSKSKVGQTKLPTHIGPKIRHKGPKITRKDIKKREKLMKNAKNRKAIKETFKAPDDSVQAPSVQKPSKKAEKKPKKQKSKAQKKDIQDDKKFHKMVNDYKQKLQSNSVASKKRKWFDA